MTIALDVMGGDNAPDINMDGAKRALQDFPLIAKIYLVGREEVVRSSCDRWEMCIRDRPDSDAFYTSPERFLHGCAPGHA